MRLITAQSSSVLSSSEQTGCVCVCGGGKGGGGGGGGEGRLGGGGGEGFEAGNKCALCDG